MCIKCGVNLRTGQKMTSPGGRPGAVRPMAAARGPVPWYKNENVYSGVVLAILVLLYGSAWLSPLGGLAYSAFALIVGLVGGLLILIAAFQESVGTGFLTLCVPFYALYFIFAQCENKLAKAIWSLGMLGQVGIWFLPTHLGD
jgi:hypothetical protein